MNRLVLCCLPLFYFILPYPAAAEPTAVTVRVISQDAKFIGTGMGGIRVILRNAETREILDQGLIEGSTGDTPSLMLAPRKRHEPLSREGGAHWVGRIDIAEPTRVEVEASGPLAAAASADDKQPLLLIFASGDT
ncbi:hypothetical protein [Geoalkalibacter sp.]|uniref:hypothetical protein n=1 Tax=Geoalkalibacter sp. TaxID=3041440 RepID=UPI00272E65A9|nr:hypothetical protein [Geoalkalibacter sp.]